MPSCFSARVSPVYARWLKPRSFSWPMSSDSPTLSESARCAGAAAAATSASTAARTTKSLFTMPPEVLDCQSETVVADSTNHSHAMLAVVLQVRDGRLRVLLWQRAREPFAGAWALPGGALAPGEELEASIRRHLAQKVDVREVAHLE